MKSLSDLITKATMTHGGRYDYSKTTGIDDRGTVTITCPRHGDFQQNIYRHVCGAGCKDCGIERRAKLFKLPTEDFIKRANVIHDNKYDYSKVQYNNGRDRVSISCPVHGEFTQTVTGHLTGYGCRQCAVQKMTLTTEDFVRKSKEKHGDYYDYSKVIYTDSREKVTIVCPKHGDFEQHANAHMLGSECPKCSREARCLSNDKFVEKARLVHGDRYDYDKVVYSGCREKVTITCQSHGDFLQTPNSHLGGAGCPHCYQESRFMTNDGFIKRAKALHGDKYDYSKTNYTGSTNKVTMTCPKHGDFEQTANAHLYSGGCHTCGRDNLRYSRQEYVEKVTAIHEGRYSYDRLVYSSIDELVTITCPVHGDFQQRASNHLRGSGCKKCWISKGELAIEKILTEKGVLHYREYTLPDLVNKFRFDFYVPEGRLLIEFHGIQHFEPIDFYGGEETLAYVKENDRVKKAIANNFKYSLLEINYKTFESMSEEDFKKYVIRKLAIFGVC